MKKPQVGSHLFLFLFFFLLDAKRIYGNILRFYQKHSVVCFFFKLFLFMGSLNYPDNNNNTELSKTQMSNDNQSVFMRNVTGRGFFCTI